MTEKSIVNSIVKYLEGLPYCHVVKTCGAMLPAGTPDIIGCYRGHAFAFEVKRYGESMTKIQKYELMKWIEAGAVTKMVCSVSDVEEAIAHLPIFLGPSETTTASSPDSPAASSASMRDCPSM
jgi:hypothetical protein